MTAKHARNNKPSDLQHIVDKTREDKLYESNGDYFLRAVMLFTALIMILIFVLVIKANVF